MRSQKQRLDGKSTSSYLACEYRWTHLLVKINPLRIIYHHGLSTVALQRQNVPLPITHLCRQCTICVLSTGEPISAGLGYICTVGESDGFSPQGSGASGMCTRGICISQPWRNSWECCLLKSLSLFISLSIVDISISLIEDRQQFWSLSFQGIKV